MCVGIRSQLLAETDLNRSILVSHQPKLNVYSYTFHWNFLLLKLLKLLLKQHRKTFGFAKQLMCDRVFVAFQRTTYVWQQPLQCYAGESLPAQKVSACVSLDFWLKFGVSAGTVGAALLIGVSCYFWKKTRKWVLKAFVEELINKINFLTA